MLGITFTSEMYNRYFILYERSFYVEAVQIICYIYSHVNLDFP